MKPATLATILSDELATSSTRSIAASKYTERLPVSLYTPDGDTCTIPSAVATALPGTVISTRISLAPEIVLTGNVAVDRPCVPGKSRDWEGARVASADPTFVPFVVSVVNAPVFAAVPPIAGGDARYVLKPAPETVELAESVVNAPLEGVVLPIVPGAAQVLPSNRDELRFGTFVLDAITSGAVPLDTVLVICPDAETVVNAPLAGFVFPMTVPLIVPFVMVGVVITGVLMVELPAPPSVIPPATKLALTAETALAIMVAEDSVRKRLTTVAIIFVCSVPFFFCI